MRVHHLNCATMCPHGGRLVTGQSPARLVCHCLLVETDQGLVLVDTGLGLGDVERPGRLTRSLRLFGRPTLDPDETAAAQVERMGFSRRDVRHIVPTHLDLDHAGGLPDFPHATVHVLADEHRAAMEKPAPFLPQRYCAPHWQHDVAWATYEPGGEPWFGFEAVRALDGLPPEILLVPLVGHSRGHSGVAVDTGSDGWLLHCGDAYFHHREVAEPPACPPGLAAFQRLLAEDDGRRRHNQARLRALNAEEASVRLFCAHDAVELERFRVAATWTA